MPHRPRYGETKPPTRERPRPTGRPLSQARPGLHPTRGGPAKRSAGSHRVRNGRGLLLIASCAAMAVVMADAGVTTLVVGELAADPMTDQVPASQLTWVNVVNFAAIAALLVAAGRWADALGRRGVLAVGVVLFSLGAIAVAWTGSWPVLLGGRLLQGVGAAMMLPTSLALLLGELPAARRRGALALWSGCSGLGVTVAQGGGGALIAAHGWRVAYLCSAGLAITLLAVVPLLPKGQTRTARPEVVGTLVPAAGIAAAVLAIWHGGQWGWTSPQTVGCMAVAMAAAGVKLAISLRRAADGQALWRRPGVAVSTVASALFGAVQYTVLVMTPLYLQQVHGLRVAEAGWWLISISLAVLVAAPLAGRLGRRCGTTVVIYTGAIAVVAGCTLLLGVGELSAWMVLALATIGAGIGALATGTFTAGTLAAEPRQFATAAGVVTAARMVGGALGVAGSSMLLEQPVMSGPPAGFTTVLVAVIAVASLLAGAAVCTALRAARGAHCRAKTRRVPSEQEVQELHRLLAELRAALVQVRSEADYELSRLTSGVRPAYSLSLHS
ncbi:MFS transporter [Nonomuraea sp. NPDC050478]|uniref:MFS transporter n=1 Tax=Nonomuraea sp. NPDC050478 TaxID=3364365 RepID=UPI00378A6CEA